MPSLLISGPWDRIVLTESNLRQFYSTPGGRQLCSTVQEELVGQANYLNSMVQTSTLSATTPPQTDSNFHRIMVVSKDLATRQGGAETWFVWATEDGHRLRIGDQVSLWSNADVRLGRIGQVIASTPAPAWDAEAVLIVRTLDPRRPVTLRVPEKFVHHDRRWPLIQARLFGQRVPRAELPPEHSADPEEETPTLMGPVSQPPQTLFVAVPIKDSEPQSPERPTPWDSMPDLTVPQVALPARWDAPGGAAGLQTSPSPSQSVA